MKPRQQLIKQKQAKNEINCGSSKFSSWIGLASKKRLANKFD